MSKEEILKLLEELKDISSKNEMLLIELPKIQADEAKRNEVTSKIENINIRQDKIIEKLVLLSSNKSLLDKIQEISKDKERLFKSFSETKSEDDLKNIEKEILKNIDLWIETFQNLVLEILKSAKDN